MSRREPVELDEFARAVRRLEAERVARPVRATRPYPPATADELAAFDREWSAAKVRGRRGRRKR